MQRKLDQATINSQVWKACDTFRGTIDPAQYKDYILTMLFVKYISDVHKEKKAEYHKKYNGNEARIDRALKLERFQLSETATFDYLYANRNGITVTSKVINPTTGELEERSERKDIGELINQALESIEEANRGKLENVFRNIDFNSEPNLGQTDDRNRRLNNLLNDFVGLDLRPSNLEGNDVIGDAYEYLIGNFAANAGKKAGEFYTPKEVSMLVARLMKPSPKSRIADPACGSGSLLIKVAKEVGDPNFSLYGQEVNGSTWALARMNMFLHGYDSATIEWGDTLNRPLLLKEDQLQKFDIVVANPPFSLDKWGAENAAKDKHRRYEWGVPPKSKADYAFLLHMIHTTNDTGRVGVVVPHGVLFRSAAEGRIRERIIKENYLKAVIGLPANLFFGTGIPAAIMVFDKNKGDNTNVLFIDASREFGAEKNQNKLRPEDLDKICETFEAFEPHEKYSYVASLKEIEENDFNLNIPRYVDTFEEETLVNVAEMQKSILTMRKQLAQVEGQIEDYLKELGY